MGLDEIEQRCLEFGVSITLTPFERELGKNIRVLEGHIKELIVKISGNNNHGDEYLELYELQNSISQLRKKFNRYANDKVDLDENDDDLRLVLDEELEETKNEYLRIKEIIDEYAKKIALNNKDTSLNTEWEEFLKERAQNKVANVIVTNRALDEFREYFLASGGSKDLSLQAVEGLLRALNALENHVDLMIEDKGISKKLNGTSEGAMEYIMTKSRKGGVFRAIFFYDKHKSRILHSLLFKSEPEEAHAARQDVDDYISQTNKKNGNRTNNELLDIRYALDMNMLDEYENRILFMYKELFRLRRELQKKEMGLDDVSVNEDDDNNRRDRKNI